MDEMLAQFLIEGRDLVAEAHGALSALTANAADRGAIDSLFRATHTLKGSVALFDMAAAEQLLHSSESLLETARRDEAGIAPAQLQTLVAVIDQVDRWIDVIETQPALPEGAADIAQELIASLGNETQSSATIADDDDPAWLPVTLARPQFSEAAATKSGIAFRYEPDAECFFRGEDPFAVAAHVPELIALAVVPGRDAPDLAAMDPFKCVMAIEGLSAADMSAVHQAFRLVPEQVAFARFGDRSVVDVAQNDGSAGSSTVLRVEGAKLDQLARHAGDLSIAVHGLSELAERTEKVDRALATEIRRAHSAIDRTGTALRASIADVRLVSLAPVLRRLPRLAREVAGALGKEIHFELSGDTIQADKHIADSLFEPLLHIVRNAIDHGIESPDEREKLGKPATGDIRVRLSADGDRLLVDVNDDGRGIDVDRLRKRAIALGLLTEEDAAALADAQAERLIFMPGFSTAATLTGVSGRGVGMDVVRETVQRLQGTIEVSSELGRGTQIRIALPLNAITTRLLTVSAADGAYGLRLDQIAETVRIDAREIQPVGQGNACVIRDRTLPVVDLGLLLGGEAAQADVARLIVTDATGEAVAIRVDALGERIDAVVRPRSGLLDAIPAISGTAVLADGGVLLVLDLPELMS